MAGLLLANTIPEVSFDQWLCSPPARRNNNANEDDHDNDGGRLTVLPRPTTGPTQQLLSTSIRITLGNTTPENDVAEPTAIMPSASNSTSTNDIINTSSRGMPRRWTSRRTVMIRDGGYRYNSHQSDDDICLKLSGGRHDRIPQPKQHQRERLLLDVRPECKSETTSKSWYTTTSTYNIITSNTASSCKCIECCNNDAHDDRDRDEGNIILLDSFVRVHIPFDQLNQRSYELPPRHVPFSLLVTNKSEWEYLKQNTILFGVTTSTSSTNKKIVTKYRETKTNSIVQTTVQEEEAPTSSQLSIMEHQQESRSSTYTGWNIISWIDSSGSWFDDTAKEKAWLRSEQQTQGTVHDTVIELSHLHDTNEKTNKNNNNINENDCVNITKVDTDSHGNPMGFCCCYCCHNVEPPSPPLPRLWEPDPMIGQYLLPLLIERIVTDNVERLSKVTSSQSQGSTKQEVRSTLPLLRIWDLGAGHGRDACFLAEELNFVGQNLLSSGKKSSLPSSHWCTSLQMCEGGSGIHHCQQPNETNKRNNTPVVPNDQPKDDNDQQQPPPPWLSIVAWDQRYRNPVEEEITRFFRRRQVHPMAMCRTMDLNDVKQMEDVIAREIMMMTKPLMSSSSALCSNALLPPQDQLHWCIYAVRYWNEPLVSMLAKSPLLPIGTIFAMSHFGKEYSGGPWPYTNPKEKHVLDRMELNDLFLNETITYPNVWIILHDEIVMEGIDHGRTLIQFIAQKIK